MISVRRHLNIYHRVWFRIPYAARLAFGWLLVVGVFMALVFGFKSGDTEVVYLICSQLKVRLIHSFPGFIWRTRGPSSRSACFPDNSLADLRRSIEDTVVSFHSG